MNTILLFWIIALILFAAVIANEIRYYGKGWGLNFHILDHKNQDAWVKPFPTKFERYWLLINIIVGSLIWLLFVYIQIRSIL